MNGIARTEYRIVRGGLSMVRERPSRYQRTESRKRLHRQTHELVVRTTADGVAHDRFADWWYDLRRDRLRIYGALLRFLDLASRKHPKETLLQIPEWLRAYIEDLYDDGGGSAGRRAA